MGQYEYNAKKKEYSIDYAGFCDGRIRAVEMHCGVLRTPFPEAVIDMMENLITTPINVFEDSKKPKNAHS